MKPISIKERLNLWREDGVPNMASITRLLRLVDKRNEQREVTAFLETPLKVQTNEQCEKWLLNLHQTSNGRVRKNDPFTEEQLPGVLNYGWAEWVGLHTERMWSQPIFAVYDRHGWEAFRYTGGMGGIRILS